MVSDETITIQLNGQPVDVASGTSVVQLLELAEIRTKLVAVEVNMEIIPQPEHASRIVEEGDVIEAVTLVGGG